MMFKLIKSYLYLYKSSHLSYIDQTHEEEIRRKYRPYDELKKEFESLNMKMQTDQEILIDLIEQLNKTDNHENRKTILIDLEYYLHQV